MTADDFLASTHHVDKVLTLGLLVDQLVAVFEQGGEEARGGGGLGGAVSWP